MSIIELTSKGSLDNELLSHNLSSFANEFLNLSKSAMTNFMSSSLSSVCFENFATNLLDMIHFHF